MLKRFMWVLILVLSWSSLTIAQAKDMNLVITLSRSDLQRRVEHLFPIGRDNDLVNVKLTRPKVILREGSDRIGLRLHIDAVAAQQFSVSGVARVDGVLRFLNSTGEFYLDDASIEELQIANIAPLYLDEIRQLADGLVRDLLEEHPIYKLGQRGESTRIMGSDIQSITVHDGKMLVELALP